MIIDISSLTLVRVLGVFILLALVFYLRDVLLTVFVAVILASAFDPWVDWLQKHGLPRALSILLIYLTAFLILSGAIYLIIPPIIVEVNQLAVDFPSYWDKILTGFSRLQSFSQAHGWTNNIQESLDSIRNNLGQAAGTVFSFVFSLFGGIVSFFIILVITFYMTMEEQAMKRIVRNLVPLNYQPYITNLINRMQEKIGQWLRGQLLLSLIIFALSWLGLSVLGVKYSLVLALFAGVTELVPYLGPFIGAIPAIFIGFTASPLLGLLVIALYTVIQFLENHLIVPKIMQKAVGLNPVVTIIAILIGAKLAGVLGIILAVPVTTALSVLIGDIIESRRNTS